MIYQKQLEIRYETDILVIGGGAAGVAAAVAAARMGRDVLLVEAQGCFGGVGTSGMVPSFAAFYDGANLLSAGIGAEIRGHVSRHIPITQAWTPIQAEELKREYDRIVTVSGVNFLFFTTVADVVVSGGHVEYAVLTSRTGLYAVKANVYIDCTGDGEFTALAGGEYSCGDENGDTMPPTVCSLWAGVNAEDYHRTNIPARLEEAIEDGVFTYEDRHLTGISFREDGLGGGNIGHVFGTDPLDQRSVTNAMVWGRKSMLEYQKFYRNYVGGCENIRLVSTSGMLGVRESRRVTCDYTLCVQDFIDRANFDDEIGRYCYAVDIHVMNTSKAEMVRFEAEYRQNLRYNKGESYGIPYRSLIPVSFDNVLVAGRCMGTDRQMEASIRVMPGCYITGQAAGTAAALAVANRGEVRRVSPLALQSALVEAGAYMRKELRPVMR